MTIFLTFIRGNFKHTRHCQHRITFRSPHFNRCEPQRQPGSRESRKMPGWGRQELLGDHSPPLRHSGGCRPPGKEDQPYLPLGSVRKALRAPERGGGTPTRGKRHLGPSIRRPGPGHTAVGDGPPARGPPLALSLRPSLSRLAARLPEVALGHTPSPTWPTTGPPRPTQLHNTQPPHTLESSEALDPTPQQHPAA